MTKTPLPIREISLLQRAQDPHGVGPQPKITMLKAPPPDRCVDHKPEPGPYGVCQRCGAEVPISRRGADKLDPRR